MPFTFIYAALALLALAGIFGITWRMKGGKTALIVTVVALAVFVSVYAGAVLAMTSAM